MSRRVRRDFEEWVHARPGGEREFDRVAVHPPLPRVRHRVVTDALPKKNELSHGRGATLERARSSMVHSFTSSGGVAPEDAQTGGSYASPRSFLMALEDFSPKVNRWLHRPPCRALTIPFPDGVNNAKMLQETQS